MYLNKILLILFLFPLFIYASDLDKEQRWKEQLVADLFDGKAISLNDGESDFLGLLTVTEQPKSDAIVVLHGVGAHPDWPTVVNPVRVGLAESGWTTLSIQLPVLANDASADDYAEIIADAGPRISAAKEHLNSLGAQGVYIVAHSLGSRMAVYYLANTQTNFKGFVAIGMPASGAKHLSKIKLPMLDLYGSEDLPGVLESATNRADAAGGNTLYSQHIVEGADHFFNDMDEALLEAVSAWLNKVPN